MYRSEKIRKNITFGGLLGIENKFGFVLVSRLLNKLEHDKHRGYSCSG